VSHGKNPDSLSISAAARMAEPRSTQKQLFGYTGESVSPSLAAFFCQECLSRSRHRWFYSAAPLS
jgi:hypothetical protein